MTDPVKALGRARFKPPKREVARTIRKMFRETSGERKDFSGILHNDFVVYTVEEAMTRRTVNRRLLDEVSRKIQDAQRTVQVDAVAAPVQSPDLAKFMSAFGSLRGKGVFGDDATEFQREMREEWL